VPLRTAAIPIPESRPRGGPVPAIAIRWGSRGPSGPSRDRIDPGHFLFAAQRPYREGRFGRRMEYPPRVRALLDRTKADQGDAVAVRAKGEHYEGILMPPTGFSG